MTLTQELLEVSEDGKNIKRKLPLPESFDAVPYTVYAKGFPEVCECVIE
jgi:hypothetical protein